MFIRPNDEASARLKDIQDIMDDSLTLLKQNNTEDAECPNIQRSKENRGIKCLSKECAHLDGNLMKNSRGSSQWICSHKSCGKKISLSEMSSHKTHKRILRRYADVVSTYGYI